MSGADERERPLRDGVQQTLQRDWLFQSPMRRCAGFTAVSMLAWAAHHNDRHGQLTVERPFFEQGDAVGVGIQMSSSTKSGRTRLAHLSGFVRHFPPVLRRDLRHTEFLRATPECPSHRRSKNVCHGCTVFFTDRHLR